MVPSKIDILLADLARSLQLRVKPHALSSARLGDVPPSQHAGVGKVITFHENQPVTNNEFIPDFEPNIIRNTRRGLFLLLSRTHIWMLRGGRSNFREWLPA